MKVNNVLYINLEHRTDRKESVLKQLSSVDLSGTRFNAVKMKDGRVGCTLSHIRCLELAKQNKWDHVLIVEDDILFTQPEKFKYQFKRFLSNETIKWDVLLVAGNNLPPYEKTTNYCVKVSHCQTTTGYLVKSHYYDILIKNYKEGLLQLMKEPSRHVDFAIDRYWLQLQKTDNWYLIVPLSVVQLDGFSDIENKNIDYYKNAMLDLDKEMYFQRQKQIREHIIKMMKQNNLKYRMGDLL
jgi:glycosyl transferase family 25